MQTVPNFWLWDGQIWKDGRFGFFWIAPSLERRGRHPRDVTDLQGLSSLELANASRPELARLRPLDCGVLSHSTKASQGKAATFIPQRKGWSNPENTILENNAEK